MYFLQEGGFRKMSTKIKRSTTSVALLTLLGGVAAGAVVSTSNVSSVHADDSTKVSTEVTDTKDGQRIGPVDPGTTSNKVYIHFIDGGRDVADVHAGAGMKNNVVPEGYSISGDAKISRSPDGTTTVQVPVKRDNSQDVKVQFVDDGTNDVVSEVTPGTASPKTDGYHTTGSVNVKGSKDNQTITIGVLKDNSDTKTGDSSTTSSTWTDNSDGNSNSAVYNDPTSTSVNNPDDSSSVTADNTGSDDDNVGSSNGDTSDATAPSNDGGSTTSGTSNAASDEDAPADDQGTNNEDANSSSTAPSQADSSSDNGSNSQGQNNQELPQTGASWLTRLFNGLSATIGHLKFW